MSTSTDQVSLESVLAQIRARAKYRDEFVRQIAAAQRVVDDTESEITTLVNEYNDRCIMAGLRMIVHKRLGLCTGVYGCNPHIVDIGTLKVVSYSYYDGEDFGNQTLNNVTICADCLRNIQQKSDNGELNGELVLEECANIDDAIWDEVFNPNGWHYENTISRWSAVNGLPIPIERSYDPRKPGYYRNGVRVDV